MSEPKKRFYRNRNFYLAIGTLIVAGILFLVLLDQLIMPAYTNHDEGLTVPDITRISLDQAKKTLTDDGLRYEVNERRSNEAYPADYVIDQSPAAAKIVKPNRKVYLTVNTVTHPTVKVPKVTDMSLRNARIQLQNAGLEVGSISYESARFKNTVLRQSIDATKTVEEGISIDLTVSNGLEQETVALPDLRGIKLLEAQQKIRQHGLRVGELHFKPSRNVAPNTIIDYSPNVDRVPKGQKLNLVVSERYDTKEQQESGAVIDSTQK